MVLLKESEKLEDLQAGNLWIIQDSEEYRFTSDAVLLANVVNAKSKDVVVDFGTGSGIIPLLLVGKKGVNNAVGVEIQPQLADMASRSVQYNNLQDKIKIVNMSLQEYAYQNADKKVDIITCNPPYIKQNCGDTQIKESLKICRHEVLVTLDEICQAAGRLLKNNGRFYMVHKAERCSEIFELMLKYKIQPKEITTVCAREGDAPYLVIVCGAKAGKVGLKWNKPITIYDKDGNYTQTTARLYGEVENG